MPVWNDPGKLTTSARSTFAQWNGLRRRIPDPSRQTPPGKSPPYDCDPLMNGTTV